jgi:hypothetical protein
MDRVKQYDPNRRDGNHVIEVTFMTDGYVRTVMTQINGNCRGFSIIQSGCDSAVEKLMDEVDERGATVFRDNKSGNTTSIDQSSGWTEEDFKDMIVEAKIVRVYKKEKASA